MQSVKLQQILEHQTFWSTGADPQLISLTNRIFRNRSWWWNCQSRTLTDSLNRTLGKYYNGNSNAYKFLYTMCSLLTNNQPFHLYPRYNLITSDQSNELETRLYDILDVPHVTAQEFNLILYHIPKGKSYLRKVLDENTTLSRLRQIETFCIDGPQHFIRVYQNFNNTGANTITVFSDQYNTGIINTLFVMLPHLMGIVSREANENYELTEADIEYNKRVESLHKFFNELYEIMKSNQGNLIEYRDIELATILSKLSTLTTEYAEQFDFISGQLDSFTTRLAKARNNNALRYFNEQLDSVTRNISDYENRLSESYIKKSQLEREIAANKLLSEEDVKPFIDTIKNTKAIEILSTTDTEMVLRITAPLQYFQEADFEAYERNNASPYNQNFNNNPLLKKILHKVFVTREYQILFQAIIHIEIEDQYTRTPLHLYAERGNGTERFTQFPNPHLYHHNCWGQAQNEMQKNMCAGNFELVIMQAVAAVQSMNVAENASFVNGFLYDIRAYDGMKKLLTFIVETPQGKKYLHYDQILEYERELEKQNIVQQAENIIAQAPKGGYAQVEIPDDDANWETPNIVTQNEEDNNEEN